MGKQTVDRATLRRGFATLQASDAELLERFVTERDESAFAALVARHGPMVFGVCRRLLRHVQDAEDAFQATFLILVRKAASIGQRELLGNWLYGVAIRVATRARLLASRRQTREMVDREHGAVAMRKPAESSDSSVRVEEEVGRLPAKYRIPVVLCYLEGRSNEDAADELGCPVGTIKTRLSRAREMLRKRLTRRGLTLSTAAITAALSAEVLAVSLPPALVDSTLKAAMYFAAGNVAASELISAQAVALTKGVLHTMFVSKIKKLAALVLALALLVGGTGAFGYHLLATETDAKKTQADAKKTDEEKIQGVWTFDSGKADGQDLQGAEGERIKNSTYEFTAEKLIIKFNEDTREATYKLDPSANPKTLDLVVSIPGGEETRPGIYKLDGDTLTYCAKRPAGADERPTEFESKEGSGIVLLVLKREKK
jgi:RNA polymerase sigma factor (sigma-70 family)